MVPCLCSETELNHRVFDETLKTELKLSISMNQIINKSECISINLNNIEEFNNEMLNVQELLSLYKGDVGIYHLWADTKEYCRDHNGEDKHKMKCLYTGKGFISARVKKHLQEKWVISPDTTLYVSIYRCHNRIAKYLEQLFFRYI